MVALSLTLSQPYLGETSPSITPRFGPFLLVIALHSVTPQNFHSFRDVTGMSQVHSAGSLSETGGIRFRGVQFQTPSSVSFPGLTEFRGANSVSSFQPIIELTEFFCSQNSPTLPQNSVRLSEFSSPKQYSRNSILPVS